MWIHKTCTGVCMLLLLLGLAACSKRPQPHMVQPEDGSKAQVRRVLMGMFDAYWRGDASRFESYLDDDWRSIALGRLYAAVEQERRVALREAMQAMLTEQSGVGQVVDLQSARVASPHDIDQQPDILADLPAFSPLGTRRGADAVDCRDEVKRTAGPGETFGVGLSPRRPRLVGACDALAGERFLNG